QALIGQRQRDGYRHIERGDRDVDSTIHAAHQLSVVADYHFQRQNALLAYRQLLLQINDALAQRKEQLFLDEAALRIGFRQSGSNFAQAAVDQATQIDLAAQLHEQATQGLLIVGQR